MNEVVLKVIALLIHDEVRHSIESTISSLKGVDLSVAMGAEKSLAEMAGEDLPDVIFLEINGHREQDILNLEQLLGEHGDHLIVFVTYKGGDIETMRRLMRAGVRDAFPQPIDTRELALEFTKALSDKREQQLPHYAVGAVCAFMEAKSGSGATTLAVNVAHTLAHKYEAKTAIIDLDLQFGSVAMGLDIQSVAHVGDALEDHERIDPVFLQALMTNHSRGLDVLAAPDTIAPIWNIREEGIIKLIDTAREMYEFVVLDIPSIFMPWTIAAIKTSDPLFLVVQNRLGTIVDTKRILEHLPCFGVSRDCLELIHNRAKAEIGSISIKQLKNALNMSRIHRVRNDYKTALKAQDRGVPVVEISESSGMTKDIIELSRQIMQKQRGSENTRKGLLDRIFGGS